MVSDELQILRNMFDCITLWVKVIARSQLSDTRDPKMIRELSYLLQEIQILEFDYIKTLDACKENHQILSN